MSKTQLVVSIVLAADHKVDRTVETIESWRRVSTHVAATVRYSDGSVESRLFNEAEWVIACRQEFAHYVDEA